MSSFRQKLVYDNLVRTITFGARTVRDLEAFKATDTMHADIVDNYIPSVWARVITKEDLDDAFENNHLYVIKQALATLVWYKGSDTIEIDNPLSPNGKESKIVPNASKFTTVPAIAVYDFNLAFVKNKFEEIDDFMIEKGYLNAKDDHGNTALMFSVCVACNGNDEYLSRVQFLVERGIDVDARDNNMLSALMFASVEYEHNAPKFANFPIIRLLLKTGADVDLQNNEGYSAVMLASFLYESNDLLDEIDYFNGISEFDVNFNEKPEGYEILELLATSGANLNLIAPNGKTMLHSASFHRWKLAVLLINLGADVNEDSTFDDLVQFMYEEHVGEHTPNDGEVRADDMIIDAMTKHSLKLGPNSFFDIANPTTIKILLDYAKETGQLDFINTVNMNGKTPLYKLALEYYQDTGFNRYRKLKLSSTGFLLLEYGAKIASNVDNIPTTDDRFLTAVLKKETPIQRPAQVPIAQAPMAGQMPVPAPRVAPVLVPPYTIQQALIDATNPAITSETVFDSRFTVADLTTLAKTLGYKQTRNGETSKAARIAYLIQQRNQRLGIASPARAQ